MGVGRHYTHYRQLMHSELDRLDHQPHMHFEAAFEAEEAGDLALRLQPLHWGLSAVHTYANLSTRLIRGFFFRHSQSFQTCIHLHSPMGCITSSILVVRCACGAILSVRTRWWMVSRICRSLFISWRSSI